MSKRLCLILAAAIVVLTFAVGIAWNLLTPPTHDDFCYAAVCRSEQGFWIMSGPEITDFSQAWDSLLAHARYINGRLANFLVILLQPLPQGVADVICGLFIGIFALLLALLTYRTGSVRKTDACTVWLLGSMAATAGMWFFLPWYDYMQSTDFQANYVWPSAVTMAVLLLGQRWQRMGKAGRCATIALAIAAGWMHEAFAATLAAYYFVIAISDRQHRAAASWLLCAVLAGLVIGLVTGTLARIIIETEETNRMFETRPLVRIASQLWVGYLAVAALLLHLIYHRRQWRRVLVDALPYLAAIAAGAVVAIVTNTYNRTLWAYDLFSLLLILDIVMPVAMHISRRAATAAGAVFVILYVIWCVQLCRYQAVIYRQWTAIENFMAANADRTGASSHLFPYNEILKNNDIPSYLQGIVANPLEDFETNTRISSHYTKDYTILMPIPDSLYNRPFNEWPKVAGTHDFRGVWPYVAIADTKGYTDPTATFGPLTGNATAGDYIFSIFGGGTGQIATSIQLWPKPITLPSGDIIYWGVYQNRRRSTDHRPLIKLDR